MKLNKIASAFVVAGVAALTGCGGSSGGGGAAGGGNGGGVAANCPASVGGLTITQGQAQLGGRTSCILTGDITTDFTMTSNITWVLDDFVRVGTGNGTLADAAAVTAAETNGATLTIEAGTDVRGSNDGVLLVTRGSNIIANGTAANPITFSSASDEDFDGEGEWGGVIIQGFARHATAGSSTFCDNGGAICNVAGEGGAQVGNFGGSADDDSSGSLRYVRIAEGGFVAGPNNEINGLTLQGVGYGTSIEFIQVHNNLDDGIEWFGGTVNVKYAVLTNNDDDDLDYDEGYRGNVQYALIRKNPTKAAPTGGNDPRGIEANSSGADSVDLTDATLANVTIIGSPLVQGANSQPGLRLRGDVTTTLINSAVSEYGECFELDQGSGNATDITFTNFLGACGATFSDVEAGVTFTQNNVTNATGASLSIDSAASVQNAEAQLASAVSAITPTANGSSFDFDETDFIGAVDPDINNANRNWWAGWTIPNSVNVGVAAATCPASTSSLTITTGAQPIEGLTSCILAGDITADFTMTSNIVWVLDDFVRVGTANGTLADAAAVTAAETNGATLTIEAGTDVRGLNDGVLLVTRGSNIIANGTAANPITFSSASDNDFDGEGEWGGVIIQGFARHATAGSSTFCNNGGAICNVAGEGGAQVGNFGGSADDDSSGSLRYVRIAEGGFVAGPNNEINGLTLQGVGFGTTIEFIQVHNNLDDGIEWFGGTANVKYAVLTNNDDDDLDYDEGYRGNIQYALIQKNPTKAAPTGGNDPRAIEANSSGADSVDLTEAVLSNVTIIGSNLVRGANQQPGLRLRGDVTTTLFNSAVTAYGECFELDQGSGNATDIAFTNFLGACGSNFSDVEAGVTFAQSNVTNTTGSALTLDAAGSITTSNANLVSAVAPTPVSLTGATFTFDATDFIGAVDPDTANSSRNWWSAWAIPGSVNATVQNPALIAVAPAP